MSRGPGEVSKTGLEHEIELLEEMRKHLNVTISGLSRATRVDPDELIQLKTQGAKLLNVTEKAIIKRDITLRLEKLERRRPILRSFNQKYESLMGLRAAFSLRANPGPSAGTPQIDIGRPVANVTSDDFLTELRRVREQIFQALAELHETGETK